MPAERAGYTVSMFVIDVSPSMATMRTVQVQTSSGGTQTVEMTNLQYGLQYVKLKIQEMIFNGRKTDQCGVIVFGSEDTHNIVNDANGEYQNVVEYISITQPNASTMAKIDALEPSTQCGDPIDALIVAIETQNKYLASKKTWTRKITLVTDGESPIEVEDWEVTVAKMDDLKIYLSIIGIDFDDDELPFTEPNKSDIKHANETFYKTLTSTMASATMGTCELALQHTCYPEPKSVRSTLVATTLRIGDTTNPERCEEALEFFIKASKCTSMARPQSWKKFVLRDEESAPEDMVVDTDNTEWVYVPLKMETQYYLDPDAPNKDEDEDGDVNMKKEDDDALPPSNQTAEPTKKLEKEDLVRGFKYGTTYAPCPDGQFARLDTHKGIDICGFFPKENFRRSLSMGEIQYIWGDPASAQQQVGLSSVIQAMARKEVIAIGRWVSRDGMDPKMGVLIPVIGDNVHYLLWGQMPFADDVRKYTFASLDHLVNKKGEILTEHPYLPTQEQLDKMDDFVDAMDLMAAGEKDENGERGPWFQTIDSYNPAIHRVKQAMFHCAVVSDITKHPLPPPHAELTKYFEPPPKVVKKAKSAIEECKSAFNVKEVPKRVARARKEDHVHARDDDDDMLLLDQKQPSSATTSKLSVVEDGPSSTSKEKAQVLQDDSETEDDEDDDDLLLNKKPSVPTTNLGRAPLTPARSISPEVDPGRAPGRIIGSTYPLKDFENSLSQAEVGKAVGDLAAVITEIVFKPFASRRSEEMLECVIALRDACLAKKQVMTWNSFISELKTKCLSAPGNPQFWRAIQEYGTDLSLINKHEANQHGTESTVTENEAREFNLS